MRAAAVTWEIRAIHHEAEFVDHLAERVTAAIELGAELVVLPELFSLELLQINDSPEFLIDRFPRIESALTGIAKAAGVTVVGGSHLLRVEGKIQNIAITASPDGSVVHQPKMVITQFEKDDWGVQPGPALARQIDPLLGVLICYDVEFPPASMALAESGALAIAVPTYTETWHGAHRVDLTARARATELQVYVLKACLVGSLGREPVPQSHGSSGIYAPCVLPFPADGILAQTEPDEEGVAIVNLDFEDLLRARQEGDVRNWEDRHRGSWTFQDP